MKGVILKLCCVFLVLVLFACNRNKLPTNYLINLPPSDTIITIKNWQIMGPFFEKRNTNWGNLIHNKTKSNEDARLYSVFEKAFREDSDTSDHLHPHSFPYVQANQFQEYDRIFRTQKVASSYAACIIKSGKEQDVAFQMVMDDAVKLWVNKKLVIEQFQNEYITKNKYAYKVHLNKGENVIVVKLYNLAESKWGFNLNITSVSYSRKYPSGKNYFSVSDKYLLDLGAVLHLRVKYPYFFNTRLPAKVIISDVRNNKVIQKTLPAGVAWNIPLKSMEPGAYHCQLITENGLFDQNFIYGNYKQIFAKNLTTVQTLVKKDAEKINIRILKDRFTYLDSFAKKNVYDEQMERKISNAVFELAGIASRALKHEQLFQNAKGLHLRSFRSAIDNSVDDYMLYVPEIPLKAKLPIVIVMPFVVGQHSRFIENFPVADLERIEVMEMFSRKYGIAVLWPRGRVLADYNLNPIVYKSTFEALADVRKYYNVDADRIYLTGSCTGGLQALLMANRFPSFFAALATDGPEISYMNCEFSSSCRFPSDWTEQNNIFKTVDNYKNLPLYLFHSKNDEKADSKLTYKLMNNIKTHHGSVVFDSLNNGIKQVWIGMIPDNAMLGKAFAFFSEKKRVNNPDTVNYATYQLKFNRAYWITINDIALPGKASVSAFIDHHTIHLKTSNINSLTISLTDLPQIEKKDKIKLVLNGVEHLCNYPASGKLQVAVRKSYNIGERKKTEAEGPVSDAFASKFLIVKGTIGNKTENEMYNAAADTVVAGWKRNLLSTCDVKRDVDLHEADLSNNNLILIGSKSSNSLVKRLIGGVPLIITPGYVKVKDKTVAGTDLVYTVVYKNPYNPAKYVLFIGANFRYLQWTELRNLGLQGWHDYEVWKHGTTAATGYFDRNWR